jgi:hypothetical protein
MRTEQVIQDSSFLKMVAVDDKLIITLTPEGVEEINDMDDHNDDIDVFYRLMDGSGIIGNSLLNIIKASELGAMSEAPTIVEEWLTSDSGESYVHPASRVWYYGNYQINNFIDVILKDGKVEFQEYIPSTEEFRERLTELHELARTLEEYVEELRSALSAYPVSSFDEAKALLERDFKKTL